jgi:tRNA(fMet)-specific endonuclease VapC
MVMPFLLDTNSWIFYLKNPDGKIGARLAALSPADIRLCSIVKAELLHGAQKYGNRRQRLQTLSLIFGQFLSLPFDDSAADVYGPTRHALEVTGQVIGASDLLIASICLAHNLTIVTNNVAEFTRIPTLAVEDWTTP